MRACTTTVLGWMERPSGAGVFSDAVRGSTRSRSVPLARRSGRYTFRSSAHTRQPDPTHGWHVGGIFDQTSGNASATRASDSLWGRAKRSRLVALAARQRTEQPPPPGPPVDALVTEMHSEATVSNDVVTVDATLKIELLKQGWNVVPLRLAGVAATAATIGDEPARIVYDAASGYSLLWKNPQEQPQQIELSLQ